MPKPRLTFQQAEVRGANQVNAGRFKDRENAPVTTGSVGEPPKHLTAAVKKVWNELAQIIPEGVAGEADRPKLEIAACLLQQFRRSPTTFQSSKIALLGNMLSCLGLDPQARTKMHIAQPTEVKSTDPLSRYMDALTHEITDSIQ